MWVEYVQILGSLSFPINISHIRLISVCLLAVKPYLTASRCAVVPRKDFLHEMLPWWRRGSSCPAPLCSQLLHLLQGLRQRHKGCSIAEGFHPSRLRFSECLSNPSRRGRSWKQTLRALMVLEMLPWPNHALCRELLSRFNPPVVSETALPPLFSNRIGYT